MLFFINSHSFILNQKYITLLVMETPTCLQNTQIHLFFYNIELRFFILMIFL